MIQRIQSVYLLLVFALGIASIFLSFYTIEGVNPDEANSVFIMMSNYMYIIPVIAGVMALVTIFLYQNRKLQLKLTLIVMLLSLLSIAQVVIVFVLTSSSVLEDIEWGPLAPVLMFVFAFFARRAIHKDEKLVKSLDRLR